MKNLLTIILVAASLTACKKSELKKPTLVNFAFDLNKNFGPQSKVKMTSGEINLVDFRISGDRVEGADIAFNRGFEQGLNIDLNGSGEIQEMDFDVPQGDYQSIVLDFNIAPDQALPAMILEGTYKQTQGPVLELIFEYSASNNFVISGEDENQLSSIVMDEEMGKKVKIEFDPIYWFDGLTANQLDNADVTPQQGQDAIVLSETDNVALYEIVVARMTDSNKAIFAE